MDNFKDGYKILDITSETTYFETPYEAEFSPGEIRKEIGTKVTFNILIDRSGSYLFTKLFGGSFFAFIISAILSKDLNQRTESQVIKIIYRCWTEFAAPPRPRQNQ